MRCACQIRGQIRAAYRADLDPQTCRYGIAICEPGAVVLRRGFIWIVEYTAHGIVYSPLHMGM